MRELCTRISAEKDSEKLLEEVNELIRLLDQEQETIKAKIKANIDRSPYLQSESAGLNC
jgi:hypothetical protein